jgi:hypothetical protein
VCRHEHHVTVTDSNPAEAPPSRVSPVSQRTSASRSADDDDSSKYALDFAQRVNLTANDKPALDGSWPTLPELVEAASRPAVDPAE